MIPVDERNGNEAVTPNIAEFMKSRLLDKTFFRRHEKIGLRIDLVDINKSIDFFTLWQGQKVDSRNSLWITTVRFGNFIWFEAIDAAEIREEENCIVSRRIKQMIYRIFVLRRHPLDAATAFILRVIHIGINTFDVTAAGQREYHAFIRNKILHIEFGRIRFNHSAAFIRIFFLRFEKFVFNDTHQFMLISQDAA